MCVGAHLESREVQGHAGMHACTSHQHLCSHLQAAGCCILQPAVECIKFIRCAPNIPWPALHDNKLPATCAVSSVRTLRLPGLALDPHQSSAPWQQL
eukprot:356594-Chlamydomonas_euryale.AAC.6